MQESFEFKMKGKRFAFQYVWFNSRCNCGFREGSVRFYNQRTAWLAVSKNDQLLALKMAADIMLRHATASERAVVFSAKDNQTLFHRLLKSTGRFKVSATATHNSYTSRAKVLYAIAYPYDENIKLGLDRKPTGHTVPVVNRVRLADMSKLYKMYSGISDVKKYVKAAW